MDQLYFSKISGLINTHIIIKLIEEEYNICKIIWLILKKIVKTYVVYKVINSNIWIIFNRN